MKTYKIIILSALLVFAAIGGIIAVQINNNDSKINSVTSDAEMSSVFLESMKNKDYDTLRFFHCRAKGTMEQVDVDQYLQRFVDKTGLKDWTNVNLEKSNSVYEIKNLDNVGDMYITIETQNPSIFELKTKDSLCFYLNGNSSVFKE